ncbi:MAG: AAA family ATPase [Hyphomicrobiaceae bacterium]|nr:AAA family ATPase [Hyphomicrobiaceae bacterium]
MMTVYILQAATVYTAQSSLLIFNTKLAFTRDHAVYADLQHDPLFLDTQIEILRSDKIALTVIDRQGLVELPTPNFIQRYWSSIKPPSSPADEGLAAEVESRRQAVLKAFRENFQAERNGLSNVVTLSYTGSDPELVAKITNDVARAYIEDQDLARTQGAKAASPWIRDRIQGLGPNTRIIAVAAAPTERSNTPSLVLIGTAALAGALLGAIGVLARELVRNNISTLDQAAAAASSECFGIVPQMSMLTSMRPLLAWRRSKGDKHAIPDIPLLSHAVDHPRSVFWQTLRRAIVAIDLSRRAKDGVARRIGVTSTVAGEGKTVVAVNLARLMAVSGKRVLLIDSNYYSPLSTRASNTPGFGLYDLISGNDLAFTPRIDSKTGLHFLPMGGNDHSARSNLAVWSGQLERFLSAHIGEYDYIVFDLPPLLPYYDVRAAAEILDHVLLVINWQKTRVDDVGLGLDSAGSLRYKLVGSVLNRARMPHGTRSGATPSGSFWTRFWT